MSKEEERCESEDDREAHKWERLQGHGGKETAQWEGERAPPAGGTDEGGGRRIGGE